VEFAHGLVVPVFCVEVKAAHALGKTLPYWR
jgi:hypothetical protein